MDDDTFFSVDCETSGPFPGRHALLSVGVLVVHRESGRWSLGESFYGEWAPPGGAEEDLAATRIHGLDLTKLRKDGIDAVEGARELAAWVRDRGIGRRVFAGYNAAFDWAFVLHAFGVAHSENPFHHAPLDIKSAIWGAHGASWRDGGTLKSLEQLVGKPIAPEGDEQAHNALDDARLQARALVYLLNYLDAARGS